MTKLTIYQTQNGWLVISGEPKLLLEDGVKISSSFNSIEKAIAHVRKVIKSWHPKPQ